MQSPDPSSHQLDTLRLYGALTAEREDWAGRLVLCCGEGCVSNGAPVAGSIAGGATLAIDSDAAAIKSAMRAGELDFVVNTLDEALRTLKNEIRQRRPLSVGLIVDIDLALEEIAERGLLPELLLIGANQNAQTILQNKSIRALRAVGMSIRSTEDNPSTERPRREVYLPTANAAELQELDQRLLEILPPADLIRRRWIERASKYLRDARTGGRWVWLSEDEQQQFGH